MAAVLWPAVRPVRAETLTSTPSSLGKQSAGRGLAVTPPQSISERSTARGHVLGHKRRAWPNAG